MHPIPTADQNSPGFTLRAVQPGDAADVVEFLNQVFGHWGSLEDWCWKYLDPPAPLRLKSHLAESQGRIIGHYGILPLESTWEAAREPAAQAIDAGVLPAYRRSGVFTALALKTLHQAADKGACLIYAFPGLLSLRANQRFSFRSIAFVPEMIRLINLPRALQLAGQLLPRDLLALAAFLKKNDRTPHAIHQLVRLRRIGFWLASLFTAPNIPGNKEQPAKELTISNPHRFDERMDVFWQQFSAANRWGLVKDRRYLTWRYDNHPSQRYHITLAEHCGQVVGCLVLRHTGLRSEIAEQLVLPGHPGVHTCLLAAAVCQARNAGSVWLSAWANPAQPCYPALRQAGFSTPANLIRLGANAPALARQLYQVIAYTDHLPQERLDYLKRQVRANSFAMGDSDLV